MRRPLERIVQQGDYEAAEITVQVQPSIGIGHEKSDADVEDHPALVIPLAQHLERDRAEQHVHHTRKSDRRIVERQERGERVHGHGDGHEPGREHALPGDSMAEHEGEEAPGIERGMNHARMEEGIEQACRPRGMCIDAGRMPAGHMEGRQYRHPARDRNSRNLFNLCHFLIIIFSLKISI